MFIVTFFSGLDQPQVTLTHNMTSMGLFEEAVPVHLSCSVQCYPPATSFAWYKLEENSVLSNDQNYTVQPQNPGMYYCEASNEIGKSTSEPVKISNSMYRFTLFTVYSFYRKKRTDNGFITIDYKFLVFVLVDFHL